LGTNQIVRELYIYAEDQIGTEFLLGIGQPSGDIIYDNGGELKFRLIITLANIDIASTYVFNYTQATEISDHNTDPNAHPELLGVLEQIGLFVQEGNYDFHGQLVDYHAITFDGTVSNGDYVYKASDGIYYKAIADGTEKSKAVGQADVTNGSIIYGGLISNGDVYDVGTEVYLSNSVEGAYTDSVTDVLLGISIGNGVMLKGIGVSSGGSGTDVEYIEANFILNNSVYTEIYYDDFKDPESVNSTATWDGVDSGWTGTTSEYLIVENALTEVPASPLYNFTVKSDIDTPANVTFYYSESGLTETYVEFDLDEIIYVPTGFLSLYIKAVWTGTATMKNIFFLYNIATTGNNEYIPHLNDTFSPSATILAGNSITLPISSPYMQNNNSLAVYLNGKRRDDVTEVDGYNITLGVDVYTTDVIRIEEVAIPPGFVGVNSNAYVIKLPTIQQLKDYNPYDVADVTFEVLGYHSIGDGGGGLFRWNSANTDADNGGTIIQRTVGGDGRFERVYIGKIWANWFGLVQGAGNGVANKAVLLNMMNNGILDINIPAGDWYLEPEIILQNFYTTISGVSPANSYSFDDLTGNVAFASTNIIFEVVETPETAPNIYEFGFGLQGSALSSSITGLESYPNCDYSSIRNMRIICSSRVNKGIWLTGTKYIEDITITGFIDKGISITHVVNQTVINKVTCANARGSYEGTGLHIDGTATTGFNTTLHVSNSEFRNTRDGISINNLQGFSFDNCVVESVAQAGLRLENITNYGINKGIFSNVWFENCGVDTNIATTGRACVILSNFTANPDYWIRNVKFVGCNFSTYVGQMALNLNEYHDIRFEKCAIGALNTNPQESIKLVSSINQHVVFDDCSITPILGSDSLVDSDGVAFNVTDGMINPSSRHLVHIIENGSRVTRTPENYKIGSIGDTPSVIPLPDLGTLTCYLDNNNANNQNAIQVLLTDGGTGAYASFIGNAVSFTELADPNNLFAPQDSAVVGQFSVYLDVNTNLAIFNNVGSTRNITVNVIGTRVYDAKIT